MALVRKLISSFFYLRRPYYTSNVRYKNFYAACVKEFLENHKVECKIIAANTDPPKNVWKNIRDIALQIKGVTEKNVDVAVIEVCVKIQNTDAAISYFKFLKKNGYDVHIGLVGKYLKLYRLKYPKITESDKMDIIETYNNLMKEFPEIDSITAECCIIGLCYTNKWTEACTLLNYMTKRGEYTSVAHSAVISAAFHNGNITLGWKYLEDLVSKSLIPHASVYTDYIECCEKDMKTFNTNIEKIFRHWEENNIIPSQAIVEKYKSVWDSHDWCASFADIKEGECQKCSNKLLSINLNNNEFNTLRKGFTERVLLKSDLYLKSNPEEIKNFMKFVDMTKPYDIVIDGLNIANIGVSSTKIYGVLPNVIQHFIKQKKTILIIARKHMNKYFQRNAVYKKAYVFLVDDLTSDDEFLLYATFASGDTAKFVSLDLMRQHKFSLKDDHLKNLFQRWLLSHKYHVSATPRRELKLRSPHLFCTNVQKTGDWWHIPYDVQAKYLSQISDVPNMWSCFKMPSLNNETKFKQ